MIRCIVAFLAMSSHLGCGEEENNLNPKSYDVNQAISPPLSKADAWQKAVGELQEGEVTIGRLSLGSLRGQPVEHITELNTHFTRLETQFNGSLKADTKRGLVGTLTAQRISRSGENGVLREDRYQANGALEPLKWLPVGGKASSLLPFKINAGTEIRFYRLFEHEEDALQAPDLTPQQLPFDLERALALAEGVMVEIPIEAQVSLNLNGQLLTKAWGRSNQLAQLLSTSSTGFVAASIQGALLLDCALELGITRLSGSQLRVRITQQTQKTQQGSASIHAGNTLQAKLLPSASVERVKNLKDRLLRWGKRPSELVRNAHERLSALTQGLPVILKGLSDIDHADRLPWWLSGALESAQAIEDPAFELLKRGGEGLAGAEDWLHEQVEQRLGAVDASLNPAFTWVKQHSERAFNLQSSIQLRSEDVQQIGLMGDYILDLSTPRGAVAFELLLSGRAQWEGLLETLNAQNPMIDLTVVDQLAEQQEEGVRRLARAELNGQKSSAQIQIRAPLAQWQFEQERDVRQLDIERGGEHERWEAEIWRVDRGLEIGPVREREQLSVGITLPVESNERMGWQAGALWFHWNKNWPAYEAQPVTRTLAEALNLTGRLGVHLGLMSHFNAEAAGAVSSQLTVTLDGILLDALFEEVSPTVLWRVVAQTAAHFDNRFGLPYLNAFGRPSLSSEASDACDEIAYHWGSQYCWLVQESLIDPLLNLRNENLTSDQKLQRQRQWLSDLSRSQLLLNPIGARVMIRILTELAYELDLVDAGRIKLSLHHPTHAESCLTEHFESELVDEREPQVSFEVAEWLGIGEGLTLNE